MGTWDDVEKLVKAGQDPIIQLEWSMCVRPEKKKPGRPRKVKKALTLVEIGALPLLGDRSRPKCLNPKCKKRLTGGKELVCGDHCLGLAIMRYQAVVDLLKGEELPVEDVPDVS